MNITRFQAGRWAKRVRAGTIKSTGGEKTILALALGGRLARWGGRCAGVILRLLASISSKRALMRVAYTMVAKARKKINLDGFGKNVNYLNPAVTEIETLSNEEQMNEMMMLGLRMTREGVSEKAFYERFAVKLEERYSQQISKLIKLGLVEWVEGQNARYLRLTQNGYLLGNRVFQEFV